MHGHLLIYQCNIITELINMHGHLLIYQCYIITGLINMHGHLLIYQCYKFIMILCGHWTIHTNQEVILWADIVTIEAHNQHTKVPAVIS